MATKKSSPKKAAVKKSAPKKTPAKKSVARKSNAKSTKYSASALRSYVALRKEESDFFTFRVTRETFYWIVLGVVVVAFTMWIMKLQSDINAIYDQIDVSAADTMYLDEQVMDAKEAAKDDSTTEPVAN